MLIFCTSMDFDSLKDAQTGLGTDVVIVTDKSTDFVADIACFAHVNTLLYAHDFVLTSMQF